jgi:GPH family glycoside/pentoside/hexuronide:cation symporter
LIAFFTVEKFLSDDQKKIVERQKAEVLAAGGEWIDPEERLRREQEEADKLAEEARRAELKTRCEKRGLSFEEEEKKYLEKLAAKKKK